MRHTISDLTRFAEFFKDEAQLRIAIEKLLSRIPGVKDIRVLHGKLEYGKDIIFRGPGGLSETRLYACVIKNTKISGSAAHIQGARTVLLQAEQALDTGFLNEKGLHEVPDAVYVMSPYECTQEAISSIRGKIRARSGQVIFKCGRSLLDLFEQYWPDFLIFDSTLLGSYIVSIQNGLKNDNALANLLFRHGLAAGLEDNRRNLYVRPRFGSILPTFQLKVSVPQCDRLLNGVKKPELVQLAQRFRSLAAFLKHPQCKDSQPRGDADDLVRFANDLLEEWNQTYEEYKEETSIHRYPSDQILEPDEAALKLESGPSLIDAANDLLSKPRKSVASFRRMLQRTNRFASQDSPAPLKVIGTPEYLQCCRLEEMARDLPSVLEQKEVRELNYPVDLLDRCKHPMLVTGSAGFGKTSFCRWNTLHDLKQLASRRRNFIPIYIQLHSLSQGVLGTYQDVFFPSQDLRQLFGIDKSSRRKPRYKARLYLDGLDEVPSVSRQRELVELARAAFEADSDTQVVFTGRNHVSGPWLNWLSRVRLQEFSQPQIYQLTLKWLGGKRSEAEKFLGNLTATPALQRLMGIPLLGTLILTVYSNIGTLPETRVLLYRMFVELLAGGWDAAKRISRDPKFGRVTKIAIITRLAGILHQFERREATLQDLEVAINATTPALSSKAREVLEELIQDCLLVPVGASFTFPHLSFQEYLTSQDLGDPSGNQTAEAIDRYLTGNEWWREVLSFYVSASTSPDRVQRWIIDATIRTSNNVNREIVKPRAYYLFERLLETHVAYQPAPELQHVWASI